MMLHVLLFESLERLEFKVATKMEPEVHGVIEYHCKSHARGKCHGLEYPNQLTANRYYSN